MTFGKRTAAAIGSPRRPDVETASETRRGGYWLALFSVPATFAVIAGGMGVLSGAPMAEWLIAIPMSALSLAVVAAIVFLIADFVLRAIGWRNPWVFAVVCGLALFGLCFATPLPPKYLVPFALLPGFCGGWVLGWSRR